MRKSLWVYCQNLKGVALQSVNVVFWQRQEGKYSHEGILIFNDKAAYEACMQIIKDADWDDEIVKQNRYETYILDHELWDTED